MNGETADRLASMELQVFTASLAQEDTPAGVVFVMALLVMEVIGDLLVVPGVTQEALLEPL